MATTFVVDAGDIMRPWRNCEVKHFPEDASQTFKMGEPLIAGGAGLENKVKISADNPTAALVGVALADATGVTGAKVPVALFKGGAEFLIRTIDADAVDFSDIGTARAIQKDATNVIWVVDTADASNDSVVVLEYRNPNTKEIQTVEGDTSVWAVVRAVPGATIWGPGAGV
jgi:hypothetical protein